MTTSTAGRVFRKDTIITRGYEIPLAMSGSGERTLICVNGMQQTMAVWRSLLKRMAATDHRTVLFDFPNQGRAWTAAAPGSLTLHDQVEVLHAVVMHVSRTGPVALLGGSWGALVSAAYAATHPQRVSRLVLGGFQTTPNPKLRDVARRGRALIDAGKGSELASLFLQEFGMGIDPFRRAAIETQFLALRPEQFRQMYDSAIVFVEQADFESLFDLRRIVAETLIVNGDRDPLIDWAQTPEIAARFPAAAWHIESGVGHFLHFERPSLLDVYVGFLTGRSMQSSAASLL